MPKKACCCNERISWPTSCCKPPENSCVGSTISISVDFYVKFFCEPNGNILIWKCFNGEQYPINFETEHWRMNLTYTLSEDDVAPLPPRAPATQDPSVVFVTGQSVNSYYNIGVTGTYAGGAGSLGGVFSASANLPESGKILTGRCIKCENPCDASTKIGGCEPHVDCLGDSYPDCMIGPPVCFPTPLPSTIIDCGDCCYEDVYDHISFEGKYHACDMCNEGTIGYLPTSTSGSAGAYSIGVKKIKIPNEPPSEPSYYLSSDISLRENATWTFDFIPSTTNQVSKLNIQLLSCHFGCSTVPEFDNPGVYVDPNSSPYRPYYYDDMHLVDMYNIKFTEGIFALSYSIPRYHYYMCSNNDFGGRCDMDLINPNLRDKVCFEQTQYYNPPWCLGIDCNGLLCNRGDVIQVPCGSGFGGFNGSYDKNFATICGCKCGEPGTCHRHFHPSGDPDQILRPHQLSFELGIGYRSTTPCGEAIQMDFYEELYTQNLFDNTIVNKIEKHLVSPDGDRYVNPEWIYGMFVASEGSIDFNNFYAYNFYSQGMRLKLAYTRNSIPYEKYNHNGVESCVPETIVGPITDYSAKNKTYIGYPKYAHPNLGNHPQGIYEGEYALSKISYWAPSLNVTYNTWNNPNPLLILGSTSGIPQPTPPVPTEAFNKCYPFNTYINDENVRPYPATWSNGMLPIDVDDPTKKQGYPTTFEYSYGDLTAIVRQV